MWKMFHFYKKEKTYSTACNELAAAEDHVPFGKREKEQTCVSARGGSALTSQRGLQIEALLYLAYCTASSLIYLGKFPGSALGLNVNYYGTENINLIAVPVQFGFSWNMTVETLNTFVSVASFTTIWRYREWCKHYGWDIKSLYYRLTLDLSFFFFLFKLMQNVAVLWELPGPGVLPRIAVKD